RRRRGTSRRLHDPIPRPRIRGGSPRPTRPHSGQPGRGRTAHLRTLDRGIAIVSEESPSLAALKTKIFADGASVADIGISLRNPLITGFTTNPTLMRKAGVDDYATFAREVLTLVGDKPVSFEVLSDDFGEMETQAREIASWGDNVYVKVPVTDTS